MNLWDPEKIRTLVGRRFPQISFSQNLEEQLSSIETMDLLLVLENEFGFQLRAIELEPLLHGNLPLFCEVVNGHAR